MGTDNAAATNAAINAERIGLMNMPLNQQKFIDELKLQLENQITCSKQLKLPGYIYALSLASKQLIDAQLEATENNSPEWSDSSHHRYSEHCC